MLLYQPKLHLRARRRPLSIARTLPCRTKSQHAAAGGRRANTCMREVGEVCSACCGGFAIGVADGVQHMAVELLGITLCEEVARASVDCST